MQPLHLNIRVLRRLYLWPDENKDVDCNFLIKHTLTILTLMPSETSSLLGMIYQLNEAEDLDLNVFVNQLIGFVALAACVYMCECFIKSIKKIRNLAVEISEFGRNYKAQDVLDSTEKTIQLYTKGIILYGLVGNLCYAAFPILTKSNCEETRQTSAYERDHDPCGLILRIWYPFVISHTPLFEIAFFIQAYTCTMVSLQVLTITITLVGLLMYGIALLKDCGQYIEKCCEDPSPEKKMEQANFCVRYHTAIIQYSTNIGNAFSTMMIVHITVTSFEISILCFEIIMVDSILDSIRFLMHLCGWLVLLFLVCFFGQGLIDESTRIGVHAYSASWYNAPVKVQKYIQLMILRSQKPLTLSAASLGVMSLESYLGVISTAYSYFTLLLNMKE